MDMPELIVDTEFRDLLPQARKDEDEGLEASIMMTGGPLEEISVWKGHDIIIDGHRRYAICRKHNLPFKVREMEFSSRDQVIAWMRTWQCDRRNLHPNDHHVQRVKLAEWIVAQGVTTGEAVMRLKKAYEISERTARRDVAMAKNLAEMPAEVLDRVRTDELPTAAVQTLAKMDPVEAVKVVTENPDREKLKDALRNKPETPKPPVVPKGKIAAFHAAAKQCREQLGVVQRSVSDLSRMVPNSHADLRDIKRMLGDCDDIVQTWITAYEGQI